MNRFENIPYADLSPESSWTRLGKGSFGCVYKGEYLGIEVAIKEVLASGEYDVDKYFKREVKMMQEARHPNIVQYLGLCLAPQASSGASETYPAPGGIHQKRILIVSEYLPRGNLRSYLFASSATHPLPWRLRISFAIDISRSVAYLHARQCLHRDLKGENALVTENERVKICDFGFARIAAQNEEEMRRMSYCGTDGYMAPEILMGDEFHLPADIFSLGVIFVEIITRTLVDGTTFTRQLPYFGISESEIRSAVSPHCPSDFLSLTLKCLSINPSDRPNIRVVLSELRKIETEILKMESKGVGVDLDAKGGRGTWNVGSVSFAGTRSSKRSTPAPRLPSFEGLSHIGGETESDDEDLASLRSADLFIDDEIPAVGEGPTYDLAVVKGSSLSVIRSDCEGSGSTITFRPQHLRQISIAPSLPSLPPTWIGLGSGSTLTDTPSLANATVNGGVSPLTTSDEEFSSDDEIFHSAILPPPAQLHRFSLVKPNFQRFLSAFDKSGVGAKRGSGSEWLNSGSSGGKCGLCEKKLGLLKASLECDDCGFRCHIKCSDMCPAGCGAPLVPRLSAASPYREASPPRKQLKK